MRPPADRRRGTVFVLVLFGASVAAAGLVTWEAVVIDPVVALPESVTPASESIPPLPASPTLEAVLATVEVDPFHPERRAPDRRYGLVADAAPDAQPTEPLRLTGTALLPSRGAFVLVALGAESPRILRLGDSLGAYRLVAVREGEADFRVEGQNVTLSVLRPGS